MPRLPEPYKEVQGTMPHGLQSGFGPTHMPSVGSVNQSLSVEAHLRLHRLIPRTARSTSPSGAHILGHRGCLDVWPENLRTHVR